MIGHAGMADEKILILGGKGMLGTDLAAAFKQRKISVGTLDLPEFDITDKSQLQKATQNAQIIINCAAYTNVEKAETESDLAYAVNATAVGALGEIAAKTGTWVLHISTDFVFDGNAERPYVETDPTNPINAYGKSKHAGEQLLVKSRCSNCIMSLEWTYGANGNNFITKLVTQAKQGKDLNVVDDQIGSPTATTEAADAICELVEKKPQGLFHFASTGYVSRFDMAKFVFDKLNMNVNLSRCKTSDYKSAAARPLNSRFDCGKIQALLTEPVKNWQLPLENFLRQL